MSTKTNLKLLTFENWTKEITIVIDQQEKKNYWIVNYYKEKKINHKIQHMKAGDYGYIFNDIPQKIIIERKNSLNELSSNLATQEKKIRFYNEFAKVKSCDKYILIENDNIDLLLSGTYGTKYNKNSYLANFILLQKRHNIFIHFVSQYNMAEIILRIFYYHYYEIFNNEILNQK